MEFDKTKQRNLTDSILACTVQEKKGREKQEFTETGNAERGEKKE